VLLLMLALLDLFFFFKLLGARGELHTDPSELIRALLIYFCLNFLISSTCASRIPFSFSVGPCIVEGVRRTTIPGVLLPFSKDSLFL